MGGIGDPRHTDFEYGAFNKTDGQPYESMRRSYHSSCERQLRQGDELGEAHGSNQRGIAILARN